MIETESAMEILKDSESLLFDGHDSAILGIGSRCGQPNLAVYDRDLIIDNLINDGMNSDEAEEWVGYNMEGAWVGDKTQIILEIIQKET